MNLFPSSKNKGQQGEDLAVKFLQKNGFRILARNYRSRYGEVDIIARDKDTVCFIEVKTRSSNDFGYPYEAVSAAKQRKIQRIAEVYLSEQRAEEAKVRFDVVSILMPYGELGTVEILRDAFDGSRG